MALNPEQFSAEYPYPRLREAYARTWAKNMTGMINSEGDVMHPSVLLPAGRDQAEGMLDIHFSDTSDHFAKGHLVKQGFLTRHQTKKDYSSWFN